MMLSIKKQLTFVFIGLTVSILLICIMMNTFFLKTYYISNKATTLVEMYEQLCVYMEEGTITSDEAQTALAILMENGNISFMIHDEEAEVIIASSNANEWLQYQLTGYQFEQNATAGTELRSTDDYEIWKSTDSRTAMEYIEMWGYFDTGEAFILRTPMESIEESVFLANRFFLNVGILLMIFSVFIIRYCAKRISTPILELAQLSTRMANLDFEVKYIASGNNEIQVLGASFNAMSYKLEQAISDLKKANNELLIDIENKEKLEEMRTEFLSNVSHELKTPIALIQGYAEGLQEGISDDKESRDFYCEVIMDEAEKMNQLVKGLLELNQLENSTNDSVMERFDIMEIVNGVAQSLDIMIQQKECKLILDTPPLCYVWGDQFKVEHVIRN
ncbi:MAG: HAMP domain-containing sensor histidine kinase, partial [Eubacteriales bacterium]